jgi:hypothetical protein
MTERFTLLSELGRGGMGVVWKARDEESGSIVALKLLRETYAEDPDYVTRFERELELAKRIHSRNVVQVLGYGVRDKVPYLALEYVDGPSLRERLASHGPYAWPEAKALLAQIAQGLADAHAAGVVHRDLKPSNILIGSDGVPKIADFGIAKGLDLTRVTGTSTLLGTPAYLAPEGPADERSDLYSLGVIAYELLTGVVPFEGRTYQEVILRHVREAPDLEKLPAEARPIVGWLLAKDAAERPQSAHDLLPVLWGGTGVPAQPPLAQAAGPVLATAQPVPAEPVFAQRPSPPVVATGAAVRPTAEPARPAGPAAPAWTPAPPPAGARAGEFTRPAGPAAPVWITAPPPSPARAGEFTRPAGPAAPVWITAPPPSPSRAGERWTVPPSAFPPVAGHPLLRTRRSRRSATPGQWLTAACLGVCLVLIALLPGFLSRSTPTSDPGAGTLSQTHNVTPGSVTGTFSPTGSMAEARYLDTATLLPDGRVLIAGGYNGSTALDSAELYDPSTGTFSPTGSMTEARDDDTATLLSNGRVLVVGGYDDSTGYGGPYGNGSALDSAELYDPSTGTFSPTGSMTEAHLEFTATLLPTGRVLIAGGGSAELYDPSTGTFSPTGSMTDFRSGATATLLPTGRVLIAGGLNHSAELYDPKTGKFSPTGSMTAGVDRADATATLLSDGRVLIAGGPPFASGELYDLTSGTFSPTGSMAISRGRQTSALLRNGFVLIAGGAPPPPSGASDSAELYDPQLGIFGPTGSMTTARSDPTVTMLSDGRVLIAGGVDSGPLASAELYTP